MLLILKRAMTACVLLTLSLGATSARAEFPFHTFRVAEVFTSR